jgi:hypothetical protein
VVVVADVDRNLKLWFDTSDYIRSILFYQIIISANVFVSFSVFCVGDHRVWKMLAIVK